MRFRAVFLLDLTRPRGGLLLAFSSDHGARTRTGGPVETKLSKNSQSLSGRVLVPALLYMAGAPFFLVLLLWFFFFRG